MIEVIGDDGDDVQGQFPGPGPEQQIVEAVLKLGDHDQHATLRTMGAQLPAHAVTLRQRLELCPQLLHTLRTARGFKVDAHEEVAFGFTLVPVGAEGSLVDVPAVAKLQVVDDVCTAFQ